MQLGEEIYSIVSMLTDDYVKLMRSMQGNWLSTQNKVAKVAFKYERSQQIPSLINSCVAQLSLMQLQWSFEDRNINYPTLN